MKYGITVNGCLREVVAVESPLPSWAQDDAAWLAKMFPGFEDWKVIPDDAFPGTIDNGDGTFTNPPSAAPQTGGRALRMDEFLKIGYGIGLAEEIDEALTTMPSLGLFLSRHAENPGIEFADAVSQESTTIKTAFARMKAAGLITDEQIAAFTDAWAEKYPA